MAAAPPSNPPPAVPGRIFFSCAPGDHAEVSRLAAALARHELPVFPPIPPGEHSTPAGRERAERELRACDLFLPVISARSEATPDAPFRREWELAAERLPAANADRVPFLVPLLLENIPVATAHVPEAFRTTQWVPLPAADEEAALTARLQEMLHRHENFRLRRDRSVTPAVAPAVWVPVPEPDAPPPPAPRRFGPTAWIAAGAAALGLALVAFLVFRPVDRAPTSPAMPATGVKRPTAGPRAAALDPTRIFLASFDNLTGDPVLDNVGREIGDEFTRTVARTVGFQVAPGQAPELAAALDAARAAGAGILVRGSYAHAEKDLQLRIQVVFVASGISYGLLGPIVLDRAASSPVLAEAIERLITGVAEASAILQDPPTNLSKLVYSRLWARWPLAQQARALAALPLSDTRRRIADAQAILKADSGMCDVTLALARAYRDAGRYDEADVMFVEVYNKRGQLSESELFDLLYDRSLLLGNLETALSAARDRAALRPHGGAIDDLVSCLFMLNRPRTAFNEFASWLETERPNLSPAELARRESEAATLEILAHVRLGETAKAQVRLGAFKSQLGTNATLASLQLEALVLARAGSLAEFDRLLARVNDLPAVPVLAPVRTAYDLHCEFLQVGRADEAAHFLDRAKRLWAALPPSAYNSTEADALLLQADLSLAQNRPQDALAALDRAAASVVAAHPLDFDGRRALALQDLGRTADFAALLAKLESADLRNSHGLPLYWRARLAARAGLQRGAIELLRSAINRGLWFDDAQRFAASYGRSEPEFATLHGVSAYDELLRQRN